MFEFGVGLSYHNTICREPDNDSANHLNTRHRSVSGYNTLMLPNAFRRILPAAIVLFILGGGGLTLLVTTTYPVLWARWVFFLCLVLLFAGLTMPAIAYLHQRFFTQNPTHERTVLRESLWLGLYVGILAWLQLGRSLNSLSALILALGLLAVEALVLTSEKSNKHS